MSLSDRKWKHRLNVGDVFHDDELSLPEKGVVIASRIKRARFYSEDDYDLVGMVEELEDAAQAGDERWFDLVWNGIYDWADANRVWIETFQR